MKQNRLASHFRSRTPSHSHRVLFRQPTASPRLIGGYIFNQNNRIAEKSLPFAMMVESNCFEAKSKKTCRYFFRQRETLVIVACRSSSFARRAIDFFEKYCLLSVDIEGGHQEIQFNLYPQLSSAFYRNLLPN